MPDIADTAWSERDDLNTEAVPAGWPKGAFPAYTDQTGQMMMGATKRFWNKSNPVYLTSGTGDNYVVQTEGTTDQTNLYEIIRVRIDRSNITATPTLRFGNTNVRTIVKAGLAGYVPLSPGDIQAGADQSFWCNGAFYILSNPSTLTVAGILGVPNGGTGVSSVASGSLLVGAGTAPMVATTPSAVLDTFGSTQGTVLYRGVSGWAALTPGSNGTVLTSGGPSANPSWAAAGGTGTVTSVSVVSANGFAGTVATATTTPAITLTTSITGIIQGNGTAISAATTTGSGSVVLAASPTLTGTVTVPNSSFTLAKLANGTALSVPGVTGNAVAAYADITAGTDGFILRRSGTSLAFGTILSTSVSDFSTAGNALIAAQVGVSVQAFDAQLSSLIRQNSQSAAYTMVLTDGGKQIYHPSADTTARTWTIPANASVAFPIGTAITFVNDTGAGTITIAITTDTLVLAGTGTTGSRTLAADGNATAIKIGSTKWQISGPGLT